MKFLPYSNSLHKYKVKREVNKLKIFEIIFVVLFVVLFSGMLYENITSHKIALNSKEKGKYVSIDESKIFYDVVGHGKATIILDSDIGADHLEWSKFVKSIPKEFRVFYYDRAGYGLSEASNKERTMEDEVKNLSDILYRGAINGPYIFVGNSYGSLLATNFAKAYPEQVIGVMLIDPILEKDLMVKENQKTLSKEIRIKSSQKFFANVGFVRMLNNLKLVNIKNDITSLLTPENAEVFNSSTVSKKYLKAYKEELNILKNYNLKSQEKALLGEKPLVLLLSENKGEQYLEEAKKLAELSSKSEIKVISSVSNIPLQGEDEVVFHLRNILEQTGKLK
ncbi:alpha/beta hydrolase [Clostridium sp. MSJ-4]|uniref:Alpha/beta hydrolase n=1 Tax=Clostridium simiarum TaxID=2841506 RepID=A0ABS6F344_9CLOT|nr:alpha/beta hydrolase [Clostridium simiarum]MBU5592932.1 alpha/beta hydrolase [Clostridium simiarum]